MMRTIEMQDMRYLNLFERVTGIRTKFCLKYNEALIFCVPKSMIFKAVGQEGRNVKKLNEILGKKIKVIASPDGVENASEFIGAIVSPVNFKELEIREGEIILNAGSQNKAALIGRNKRRLLEMQKITKDFFGMGFRII